MYCICCKKDRVKPTDVIGSEQGKTEEELLWNKTKQRDGTFTTINNVMVNDGIIQIIDAGYGSIHDGDQIILAICDDCITQNLQDATILYFSNYMPSFGDIVKDEIEKSKKTYRRRKNLDQLTENKKEE